jgi:hypothetical protein
MGLSEQEIAEYEEGRKDRYGKGLSIDEWLAAPSRESFLVLAYRIREANRK